MLKKLLVLAGLLAAGPALAQNVQYVSPVTRNHIPVWNTNGVIADGGSSADSPISSIGVTNEGGAGFCVSSQRQTAAGRNQLCFNAATAGPATISLQNYGTASPQNLQFIINGVPVTIPTGGSNFLQLTGAAVNGHVPCFSGTIGLVVDCGTSIGAGTQFGLPYYSTSSSLGSTGAGTNGQFLLGQTGSVPLWATLSGDVGSVSPAGALTLAKVNGVPFASTYTAHGVLIAQGTSQFNASTTSNIGSCLISQGLSADPIWTACASGSGSAGGLNTQVQFNNSTSLAGSANLTWVSPALTIGQAGTTTGQLQLAPAGSGSGTVTVQNPSTTAAYNFNLPTTAGSLGQPLLSGGGGSTAMSFGTLGIAGGGTNCSTASGTCLDNITSFGSIGYINRTGGGTYAFATVIPVSGGGTALASGTSGGILGYTASGTLASSAALTQFGLVVGGGAGFTPTAINPGSAGQILVAQTSANPSWNTMSGDATLASSGALTIAASAVTVAKQANAAAYTIEGNFTGSSAAPQFSTIGALTQKVSPAASDLVILQDQAASGQLKYATVSSIASAGSVSSIAGNTGSFTLAAGVTNSTNQIQMDGNYTGWGTSNCTLAASVGSNLLTVALKDNAGNDPSSTSPCYINYRSATAATGSTTLVSQTAALSISTFATGATLGSSNSTAFRFWVVSFNNSGTNVLALINCSNATTIFPLNENIVATSVGISGSATSAGVFYTPNGITLTNKAFRIIGYIEYNSTGLATAGTYASGPNFIQNFGPGSKKPGDEIAIAYTTESTAESFTTATYVAATSARASITPQSAVNIIFVQASGEMDSSSPAVTFDIQLSRGTSNNTNIIGSNSTIIGTAATSSASINCVALDKPNATSSQTYALQGKLSAAGTGNIGSASRTQAFVLKEIMG